MFILSCLSKVKEATGYNVVALLNPSNSGQNLLIKTIEIGATSEMDAVVLVGQINEELSGHQLSPVPLDLSAPATGLYGILEPVLLGQALPLKYGVFYNREPQHIIEGNEAITLPPGRAIILRVQAKESFQDVACTFVFTTT